jgi:hypothetical protein
MTKKKYIVTAKKWDDERQDIVEYVAGEFYRATNAALFKSAYDDYYGTSAEIKIEEVQI